MFSVRYFVCAFIVPLLYKERGEDLRSSMKDPFELVRKWFQAFNAGDLEAVTALYHQDAINDAGPVVSKGRDLSLIHI